MKPAVSAGSRDTNRYLAGDHDELAVAHAPRPARRRPHRDGAALPAQVDTDGETALLFFAGEFSHAIRKGPLLAAGDGAGQPARYKPEAIEPREPSDGRARRPPSRCWTPLAAVAPAAATDLVYARVDLVPGPDGSPTLLELELTEPSMFLVRRRHRGHRVGGPVRGRDPAALGG